MTSITHGLVGPCTLREMPDAVDFFTRGLFIDIFVIKFRYLLRYRLLYLCLYVSACVWGCKTVCICVGMIYMKYSVLRTYNSLTVKEPHVG